MKRPVYEAKYDPSKKGVYAISLVLDPAMESHFIALSKNEPEEIFELKKVDEEKRILIGLVMEPDKRIPRSLNGEEFDVVFSKETIRNLSYNFFDQGYNKNSKMEHKEWIEGVTVVESWQSEDSEKDKSAVFGLKKAPGSWFATMKIHSDTIWNDFVKTGKVKGFSIDGLMGLEQINLNKDEIMSKEKFSEVLLKAFRDAKDEFLATFKKGDETPIELGQIASGDLMVYFEGEALAVGLPVWTMTATEERVALPVGEYPLESGITLVVSEEGIVGDLKDEAPADAPADAPAEAPAEMSSDEVEAMKNAIKSILVKFSEDQKTEMKTIMDGFTAKLTSMENENKEMKTIIAELSKQPAVEVVTNIPAVNVELNKKGRILEKMRAV